MGEIVLGVLNMPDDLFWDDSPLVRIQHNAIRKEAAQVIAELESKNNNLMILSNDYHIENCELRERLSQYESTTQKAASSKMEQTTEME